MGSTRRRGVVCGVDLGSTNVKVVALDESGSIVARASRPTPRDPHGLWVDASALLELIDQLVIEACGTDFEVHAVCASGVGEDGILVDDALHPLTAALAWFDPRRQRIFRTLRSRLADDEEIDVDTDAVRTFVGWTWARSQPGADAARSWVALADLPGVRWSGRPFLSDTLAARTGAWRSRDASWADDRVALTLGAAELLPVVLPAGEIVAPLRSARLRAAGVVAADALVVAGGHDHPIGGWGVDQLVPGAVLDSMGTAEVVVAQSPNRTAARRDHVDVAPGICSAGTTLLRVEELMRNVEWASQDPEVASQIRDLLSGRADPAPVLGSGYFVPGRRGGGRPSYAVDAPHDARARASAVLGALAEAGRDATDAVSAGIGPGEHRVLLAGGWVRSPGWLDIKAAVNGRPVSRVLEPEVTAAGAALLAARARGWRIDPVNTFGGAVATASV